MVPTVDDGVAEESSVVTAAIQTNADYTVGAPSSSTVNGGDKVGRAGGRLLSIGD